MIFMIKLNKNYNVNQIMKAFWQDLYSLKNLDVIVNLIMHNLFFMLLKKYLKKNIQEKK